MAAEDGFSREEIEPNGLQRLRPSFHGRLLIRTSGRQPESSTWSRLASHLDRWGWLVNLTGQGSLFAGGLAIGGGSILLRLGEEWKVSPKVMIALGLGCVFFAIAVQILVREARKKAAKLPRFGDPGKGPD